MSMPVVPPEGPQPQSSTIGSPALPSTADVSREDSKPSNSSSGSPASPKKTPSYRQLQLQTSKRYQQLVIGVLMFFAFVDTLGTVLFLPAGGILCQLAEGGPMEGYAELMYAPNTTDFKALGIGDDFVALYLATSDKMRYAMTPKNMTQYVWENIGMPKAFKTMPAKFSMSMNLLNVAGAFSGAAGAAFWGFMSDRVGRKSCMLVCHVGGLLGYIIMYLSGQTWGSYWGYFVGLCLNGFFSGAYVIVMAFFLDMLPKEEQAGPTGALMSIALLGGASGSLILMPFVTGRAENLFDASWVGIGATILSFVLVAVLVVEPSKKRPSQDTASSGKDVKSAVVIPTLVKRILWVCLVGSALDAAGDEGTRIARGTIMQNIWPSTNTIMFQNIILLTILGLVMCTITFLMMLKAMVGLAPAIVLGVICTAVSQVLFLIHWDSYVPWLVIWYSGKFFGFMSTFGSDMLINNFSPEDAKGTWQGRSAATSQIAEGCSTLAIALIYDASNDGSDEGRRGQTALYITVSISVLAFLSYLPLLVLVPKEVDEKKQAKDFMSVEAYEALSDVEACRVPMEEQEFIEHKRATEGKDTRLFHWGAYGEGIDEIEGMMARAGRDFEWMKKSTLLTLTNLDKMNKDIAELKKSEAHADQVVDETKEREQMGQWVADYLNDAGYSSWKQYPQIYKAMFINAFPPIDKLNNKKTDFEDADIEHMMIRFLKVADGHIQQRRSQMDLPSRIGVATLMRKLKRR